MKELLAIYDTDEAYAKKLEQALNAEGTFPFYAMRVASEEELGRAVEEDGVKVVLSCMREAAPEAKTVILLSEIPVSSGRFPAVFKYQPLSRIRQEILKHQRVFLEADEGATSKKREIWIGVGSPVGRSLKTSFALVLGELLAQERKTLYVNLEPCSGLSAFFSKKLEHDLSELFSEGLREDWDGKGAFTETVRDLDILGPAAVPEDIYQTDPAFLRSTVRKFAEENGYETVILDLGTDYRISEAFLPTLDKLYIPGRKEALQEAKITEYREWLSRVTGPEFEEKAEILILPAPGLFSRGKNDPEQLLFSELGDFVRSLLGDMYG